MGGVEYVGAVLPIKSNDTKIQPYVILYVFLQRFGAVNIFCKFQVQYKKMLNLRSLIQ